MILASLLNISQFNPFFLKYNSTIKLSNFDKSTLETLVAEADKKRMLGSRFMIGLLIEKMGVNNLSVDQMSFSEFGKPSLPSVYVSISHSGDFIAVAVSDSEDIGIDIQEQKPINLRDFESFLSQSEQNKLSKLNDDQCQKSFFEIWTKKEAVMKADGRGMSLEPDQIILADSKAKVTDRKTTWFQQACPVIDGYSLALYSDKGDAGVEWLRFQGGKLVKTL